MRLEANPDAGNERANYLPRMPHGIRHALQVFTLAYAATMAQPAAADEQINKSESTQQQAPSLEKQIIGSLEQQLDPAIKAFGSDDYDERTIAYQGMTDVIDSLLAVRNPLPDSVFELLEKKRVPELLPEQDKRLEQIIAHARLEQRAQPGRIGCPVQANKPTAAMLADQFKMPVYAEDPDVASFLASYKQGFEGQKSSDALRQLCDTLGCVPILTPEGLILEKDPESFVLINDFLFVVIKQTPDGQIAQLSMMPDQGTLLTGEKDFEFTNVFISTGGFVPWTEGTQFSPEPHLGLLALDRNITAFAALAPEVHALDLSGQRSIVGLQSFRVEKIHQNKEDGSWIVDIHGTNSDDLDWPQTPCEDDMRLYQVTASTRFNVQTKDGQSIHCMAEDLCFNQREFRMCLRLPDEPAAIDVRACPGVALRNYPLPARQNN